jgi:hypothetical protein
MTRYGRGGDGMTMTLTPCNGTVAVSGMPLNRDLSTSVAVCPACGIAHQSHSAGSRYRPVS